MIKKKKKKKERNELYIPNYRRLVASLFVGPIRTCGIYANNGIIAASARLLRRTRNK